MKSYPDVLKSELSYCRGRPAYFIRSYCRIEDKDASEFVIPFDLWPAQEAAVNSFEASKLNIVLKARQLGLSWLVLCYAVYTMLLYEGAGVIAMSRTEEEAKELVRRVGFIASHMGEFIGEGRPFLMKKTALGIGLVPAGGGAERTFRALASAPGAGRSFTANLIILDEWAYQQYAEEIWISGFPTINRASGGKVIGVSTMKRGTLFERIWTGGAASWNRVFLPWNADPRRDAGWYRTTKDVLGEAMCAEYPASEEEALRSMGGAFFGELRRDIHVCSPFAIPEGWRRYFALDYGLDMLAGLWGAFDGEGTCYIYREVYRPGLIISEAAAAIREAEGPGEDIYLRYAPGDLFARGQESGRARSDIFAENGIYLERSNAARIDGWARVKEYLRIYREKGGKETARIKIFSGCGNLIRTLGRLGADKLRPGDAQTEPHELTHAPDALRYMLVMRPLPETPALSGGARRFYSEAEDFFGYGA